MSANQGWRMSFSSTPTVRDRRSASRLAASLGRYPSSATARSTASRRAGLTLGESRSTSDTSDLDTPARAATVSRVGLPVSGDANSPPRHEDYWSALTYRSAQVIVKAWSPAHRHPLGASPERLVPE